MDSPSEGKRGTSASSLAASGGVAGGQRRLASCKRPGEVLTQMVVDAGRPFYGGWRRTGGGGVRPRGTHFGLGDRWHQAGTAK